MSSSPSSIRDLSQLQSSLGKAVRHGRVRRFFALHKVEEEVEQLNAVFTSVTRRQKVRILFSNFIFLPSLFVTFISRIR